MSTAAPVTLRCCPTCWSPLDLEGERRRCPRCGYTETVTGELLQSALHCVTCTCPPQAS